MTRADRGMKRRCGSCGAPFYDMGRSPIICPKCHVEYAAGPRLPSRAQRPALPKDDVVLAEAAEAEVFEEDEVLSRDGDDEDTLLGGEDGDEDQDEMRE